MSLIEFLAGAALISLSGVMAPGPMTAVTVGKGSSSPHAGGIISLGHAIIEFPLMILIFFESGHIFNIPYVKTGIALIGGIFLLYMAVGMFRSINSDFKSSADAHSPLIAGILLTAGNPYFILWWATVGATLVIQSADFGISGFIIFAIMHWICDMLWLYFLSILSYRGGRFFGNIFQKIIFTICGVMLVFFSGKFIYDGLKMITG